MPLARREFDGPVAKFVLNHPNGNRINFTMREELLDAFERIAASTARVVIVSGEGVDFCAGGDIREWPDISADALRPRIEVFANAFDPGSQIIASSGSGAQEFS
jgi:enoyl-CoA hydratase/carnithine racemase